MNLKKHANESLHKLPVAGILFWRLWEATGRFIARLDPDQWGEKVRERYGRGEDANLELTAGMQVHKDEVTLPCPHLHADSYFGFSTPCVISIWKMFSLPLQTVTVLMIITNAYVSDTSTPFTGHKWYNSQNSPMRKVLSLSPLYREKKKEQDKANGQQKLASESVFDQCALITVFSNIILWIISFLCLDHSPWFDLDFVLA